MRIYVDFILLYKIISFSEGGGSTTAFVRDRGVVNYPSDNGRSDNEGMRVSLI